MGKGSESNTPGQSIELRGSEFHFFRWGNIEDIYILRIRKEYLKRKGKKMKWGDNWCTKVKGKVRGLDREHRWMVGALPGMLLSVPDSPGQVAGVCVHPGWMHVSVWGREREDLQTAAAFPWRAGCEAPELGDLLNLNTTHLGYHCIRDWQTVSLVFCLFFWFVCFNDQL